MDMFDPPNDHWTNQDVPELTEEESLFASCPPEDDEPVSLGVLFLDSKDDILAQMTGARTYEYLGPTPEAA